MNNQFQFIGRLTKDVEIKAVNDKIMIGEVNIAVNNSKDNTTFIKLKAFNKVAEMLGQYTKKGDLMGFSGTVNNNNWEDKEGKKHSTYDFIINKVSFLNTKAKQPEKTTRQEEQDILKSVTQDEYEAFASEIDESSLPF